jgi:hypothetical protein
MQLLLLHIRRPYLKITATFDFEIMFSLKRLCKHMLNKPCYKCYMALCSEVCVLENMVPFENVKNKKQKDCNIFFYFNVSSFGI